MAKIWPVYEGKEPTIGGPWAELPAREAIVLLDLRPADKVSDLAKTPRFGDVRRDRWFAGYKHIVVEIDGDIESLPTNWRSGFYLSKIAPKDAFGRLIKRALVSELGEENVERVEWEPTTDTEGQDALKITVVITPGAIRRLDGNATLDALVKVREQLSEMGDSRTPIVEYATEAELAQDASS
jgi:hypothetical protein